MSNWTRTDGTACQHNLAYWRGDDWWGVGPGAHSYLGGQPDSEEPAAGSTSGIRWWNVKHPIRYAALLEQGNSPAAGRELLSQEEADLERLMLGIRLRQGLSKDVLSVTARTRVAQHIAGGLLDGPAAVQGQLLLTLKGRLLADTVIRDLSD